MSNTRDIAAEVQECLETGLKDPESIAILLGVSTSKVEAILGSKDENRSPQQILLDDIEKMTALIEIAQMEYQNFSTNQNAQAIKTLQSARGDLIRQYAAFQDPILDVERLDAASIAPLIRSVTIACVQFIASMKLESETLVPGHHAATMDDLYERNLKVLGGRLQDTYRRATASICDYFGVTEEWANLLSIAERDQARDIEEAVEAEVAQGDVGNQGSPNRKRKKRRRFKRSSNDE